VKKSEPLSIAPMTNLIVATIAAALIVYLIVTIIRPEKF
jgi:K+-transporting ATPase KdpF subunit